MVVCRVYCHNIKHELPNPHSMILAWDGEWNILMYEKENFGYAWEDDSPTHFSVWAYLSDLHKAEEVHA